MPKNLMKFAGISAFALALCLSAPAFADNAPASEPAALSTMQTMVTNMGYTTTLSPDKQHFYFDWQSTKYTYRIDLAISTNGDLVYLYNYIDTLTPAQVGAAPYPKMLEYQNTTNFYFSFDKGDKGEDFYGNAVFGVTGATPPLVRVQLSNFVKALDETDKLWNTKLWAAAPAPSN